MYSTLEKIAIVCLTIIGFYIFKCIFQFIYNNFISIVFKINAVDFKDMGKWAVITGATDGIGLAYTEYLAKKGLNVVLISRNREKLDNVASEIATKYKVETRVIEANFKDKEEIYYNIERQLNNLEIGVLINNVGMSYPHPEYFLDLTDKDKFFMNIININILSVTNMCKIVLPGMLERKQGVIINISSVAAQVPSPLLTVYAAAKAYVLKFSDDLASEYEKFGITIQCILPGYVATKMSKIRSSSWMAPSPKKFVSNAMKTVGVHKQTTGYFPHTLLVLAINLMDSLSTTFSRWLIIKTFLNIRSRALKKTVGSS